MILLSSSLSSSYYQNLPMGKSNLYSFQPRTYYYYKIHSDSSSNQKITITTEVGNYDYSNTLDYRIDIKHFSHAPSDNEVTNVDYSWTQNLNYELDSYYSGENRKYKYEPNEEFEYIAIRIYSVYSIRKMTITINSYTSMPTWLMVIITIVNIITIILLIIGIRACLRTERGREICKVLCVCCIAITCCLSQRAAYEASK